MCVVIGLIIVFLVRKPQLESSQTVTPTPAAAVTARSHIDESGATATPTSSTTITFDGIVFSPDTVTITSGAVVVFTNQSPAKIWPASDPHPIHTGLAGFDAKKGLAQGESFQFTFTKTGTFGFHDHLNPAHKGTIIVE